MSRYRPWYKVTKQSPEAGATVLPNVPVAITLGSLEAKVPSLIGKTKRQVPDILGQAGLILGAITPKASDHDQIDKVVAQRPGSDSLAPVKTRVDLTTGSKAPPPLAAKHRRQPRLDQTISCLSRRLAFSSCCSQVQARFLSRESRRCRAPLPLMA